MVVNFANDQIANDQMWGNSRSHSYGKTGGNVPRRTKKRSCSFRSAHPDFFPCVMPWYDQQSGEHEFRVGRMTNRR